MEKAAALTLRQQGQPSRPRDLKLHYTMLRRQKAEQKQRRLKLLAPPKIWLQPRKKLPTLPVMLQRKMTEPKHLWTV